MMSLLLVGIITVPVLGISREWTSWPFFTVLLVAIFLLCAGVRLQRRLLRARLYLKFWDIDYRRLSDIKEIFERSTSFGLTISNQQNSIWNN